MGSELPLSFSLTNPIMWVIVRIFHKARTISHKMNQDPTKWAAVLKNMSERDIKSNDNGVSMLKLQRELWRIIHPVEGSVY